MQLGGECNPSVRARLTSILNDVNMLGGSVNVKTNTMTNEPRLQTRIESIRLKNFRALKDVELKDIPPFCVFVGANGVGKSTIFSVFSFLKNAMEKNVTAALGQLGGGRGLREVRTRGEDGDIEIEIKFRPPNIDRRVTYLLVISEENNRPIVKTEQLSYRRGSYGKLWRFLDFKEGKGKAVTDEVDWRNVDDDQLLIRQEQTLTSKDLLAISALAQFENFPAVVAWGELIENWQVFDFHIQTAREDQQAGDYCEVLDNAGKNLALVLDYLHNNHREVFDNILAKLSKRIPGIKAVQADTMPDGRVLLAFEHADFDEPIYARYVSDGTMRMLAYLVLLYHPNPHPLLGVEEPENQLYPWLLQELAEEFREYTNRGGQVFVSTHSPDFLNAARIDEVFLLRKKRGITTIERAADNRQAKDYMDDGDKMGRLWAQGILELEN